MSGGGGRGAYHCGVIEYLEIVGWQWVFACDTAVSHRIAASRAKAVVIDFLAGAYGARRLGASRVVDYRTDDPLAAACDVVAGWAESAALTADKNPGATIEERIVQALADSMQAREELEQSHLALQDSEAALMASVGQLQVEPLGGQLGLDASDHQVDDRLDLRP